MTASDIIESAHIEYAVIQAHTHCHKYVQLSYWYASIKIKFDTYL